MSVKKAKRSPLWFIAVMQQNMKKSPLHLKSIINADIGILF